MTDCRECKHCDTEWRDYSQLPICQHPDADSSFDVQLGRERGHWAIYSTDRGGHCGPKRRHFEMVHN